MLYLWVFTDVSDDLRAFKTSGNMRLTKKCQTAKDLNLYQHRCENIKSYLLTYSMEQSPS